MVPFLNRGVKMAKRYVNPTGRGGAAVIMPFIYGNLLQIKAIVTVDPLFNPGIHW
jgi:hypothetical protein